MGFSSRKRENVFCVGFGGVCFLVFVGGVGGVFFWCFLGGVFFGLVGWFFRVFICREEVRGRTSQHGKIGLRKRGEKGLGGRSFPGGGRCGGA